MVKLNFSFLIFFIFILSFSSFGQQVKLVKDINTIPNNNLDSNPQNSIVFNSKIYFAATDGINGIELWESDGTKAGTKLVKDINTGAVDSSPQELTIYNNKIYFQATDATNGTELWESDGTEAGTKLVKDIYSGTDSSSPQELTVYNGKLYFRATENINGAELWESDGTEAGTKLLKNIFSGTFSSYPLQLTIYNSKLYFVANDNTTGRELWESDGTEIGTKLALDLSPGGQSTYIQHLTVYNGNLYFVSDDDTNGIELWKSDATLAGTVLVKDIHSGFISGHPNDSFPQNFIVYNNKLYFTATDAINGAELWESDGTETGTKLVKDIYPGGIAKGSNPQNFTVYNNKLYFAAKTSTNGTELWETDGTESGTKLVKDINVYASSFPSNLIVYNGKLYFRANDNKIGYELWESDGTDIGTKSVSDIYTETISSSPQNFTVFNNKLYFTADDGINGIELWESDDTEAGTKLVKDINVNGDSTPSNLTVYNGKLYFSADDGTNGVELWESDGTVIGTKLFKDINLAGNSSPSTLTAYNGKLYFSADDGANGVELWKSDGTEVGTKLFKDINLAGNSSPSNLIVHNGKLYFAATEGTNGIELWESDGTIDGTKLVKDINVGGDSSPNNLTVYNGKIYFAADNGTNGIELWESDGSEVGTKLLKDIRTSGRRNTNSSPQYFKVYNNKLYFAALEGANGRELWETDGSEAGTKIVKDIVPGSSSSKPSYLTVYNNKLYFSADDGTNGVELWESDGTISGTKLVQDINSGVDDSSPSYLTVYNNKLFLTANKGDDDIELYFFNILPTVITTTASLIANTSATLAGNVTANGGTNIAERGIVFSTSDTTPTIAEGATKDINGNGTGVFSKSITSLEFGTTYYFNAYAINSSGTSYGAAATFTTTGKRWLGGNTNWFSPTNWSPNAIPIASDDVVIPNVGNKPIIESGTNAVANNITIDASSSLTINAGGFFDIDGDLTQHGTVTINSDATMSGSLIVSGTTNGNITYNRFIDEDPSATNKWHLVGSPVIGQTINDFANNANNNLRKSLDNTKYALAPYNNNFVAPASPWEYVLVADVATAGNFTNGKGYAMLRGDSGTFTFTGTHKNIDAIIPITQGTANNWNLVANPYPAFIPISNAGAVNNFLIDNASVIDPSNLAVFLWNGTQYKPFNHLKTDVTFIAPGQGFFVQSKIGGGNLTIPKSILTHNVGNVFQRSDDNRFEIILNVKKEEVTKSTEIIYLEGTTIGLDPGYDAGVFSGISEAFDVYTYLVESDGKPYSLQGLPPTNFEEMIIPIGLHLEAGKTAVFSIDAKNIPDGIHIYLEDKLTNTFTRLDEADSSYQITTDTSENGIGRFYLHTTSQVLSVDNPAADISNINMFMSSNKTLAITNVSGNTASLKIYDLLGKEMFTKVFEVKNINEIKLSNDLNASVYIARLQTEKGVFTKKIIIE